MKDNQAHIWNKKSGLNGWCGEQIQDDEALFPLEQALFAIQENRQIQPCPDCARAIIKQLLKAIE